MTRAYSDLSRVVVLGGLLVAGVVTTAYAADPLEVIKARQQDMKKVGGAMKAASAFVKDDKGTAADVAAAAAAISQVAKLYDTQFPEGTAAGVGDSEALPAIWQDTAKFKADLVAMDDAAVKLGQAAATGDKAAIGKAVGDVGATCKQCHETFRQKK